MNEFKMDRLEELKPAASLANIIIAGLPDICEEFDVDHIDVGMLICGFLAYRLCGEEDSALDEETFFKNIKGAIAAGRLMRRMPDVSNNPQ